MEGEPFGVRVRFSSVSAAYAAERTWSDDQTIIHHRDGSLTLAMTSRSDVEVISWVLSFGLTAELLAPCWLRKRLADEVKKWRRIMARKTEE